MSKRPTRKEWKNGEHEIRVDTDKKTVTVWVHEGDLIDTHSPVIKLSYGEGRVKFPWPHLDLCPDDAVRNLERLIAAYQTEIVAIRKAKELVAKEKKA